MNQFILTVFSRRGHVACVNLKLEKMSMSRSPLKRRLTVDTVIERSDCLSKSNSRLTVIEWRPDIRRDLFASVSVLQSSYTKSILISPLFHE